MTNKREIFSSLYALLDYLLDAEFVLVHIRTDVPGLSIPEYLCRNDQVALKFSRLFQRPVFIEQDRIFGDLKFAGNYHRCEVPYGAIWGVSSAAGEFFFFAEKAPASVLVEQKSVESDSSKIADSAADPTCTAATNSAFSTRPATRQQLKPILGGLHGSTERPTTRGEPSVALNALPTPSPVPFPAQESTSESGDEKKKAKERKALEKKALSKKPALKGAGEKVIEEKTSKGTTAKNGARKEKVAPPEATQQESAKEESRSKESRSKESKPNDSSDTQHSSSTSAKNAARVAPALAPHPELPEAALNPQGDKQIGDRQPGDSGSSSKSSMPNEKRPFLRRIK